MSNPKEWPLGQLVRYTATLFRAQRHVHGWRYRKEWARGVGSGEGIYIGWRTLSDGDSVHSNDEGPEWHPTKYFPAALVVFDLRCDPVLVPFDALEARRG